MKHKLKGSGFFRALLKMNMLPLILLTLVITTFSAGRFAQSLNVEAKNGLVDLCHTVAVWYDTVYEGDYHAEEKDGSVCLLKGDHLLNDDFAIIDSIKEQTGVDITIFYQDTRIVTTIRANGERVIGTKANATVVGDVLEGGQPHFYTSTMVEGVRYFSYYEPLYAADGTCIGMLFLGKPSAQVEELIRSSLIPIIVFGILTMLIACVVTIRFSGKLVTAIHKMEQFLISIAKGDLHEELDDDVVERKDELGDVGRYLIEMQKSLQKLVEQDILTELYNRRSGEKCLGKAVSITDRAEHRFVWRSVMWIILRTSTIPMGMSAVMWRWQRFPRGSKNICRVVDTWQDGAEKKCCWYMMAHIWTRQRLICRSCRKRFAENPLCMVM